MKGLKKGRWFVKVKRSDGEWRSWKMIFLDDKNILKTTK